MARASSTTSATSTTGATSATGAVWATGDDAALRDGTTGRLLRQAAETADALERKRLQDEVVLLNMSTASGIAGRYRSKGVATDDLEQVAYMGLVKAVRAFDASRGCGFLAYAVPSIHGEVKRHFRDHSWAVRPPRRVQELSGQLAAVVTELTQSLGRSPRPAELARFLEAPIEDVIETLCTDGCYIPTSLDAPVGERGSGTLGEMLVDESSEIGAAEARAVLAPAVRRLRERDRRILHLRFFRQCTQSQIAEEIGVTQMQVSRLLSKILADLRGELV